MKKRILVVYPHGDPLNKSNSGGQNRLSHLIMQAIQSNQVTTVSPCCATCDIEQVNARTYSRRTPGFVSDLDFSLAQNLQKAIKEEDPDIIHVPYPSGIILSELLIRALHVDAKILLDAHDVMSQRAVQFQNNNLSVISDAFRRLYIPTLETVATTFADHIITVSNKDARHMGNLNNVSSEKISVIPNGAELVDHNDLQDSSKIRNELDVSPDTTALVFHGNCETGTHNEEAAIRIIEEIAPRFSSQDVHFFIIGKGVPKCKSNNTSSLGYVEDLYSTLNAMDIAVVPLTSGTATKLKMFDYMSVGLPIISTKKGSEGIKMSDGHDVIITDADPESFEQSVYRVLTDPSLQNTLAENGRQLIEQRYNWDTIGDKFRSVIQCL
jgi:glycosyltransferase involved in cell wall biosynthesis